jgi:hypothetical protein
LVVSPWECPAITPQGVVPVIRRSLTERLRGSSSRLRERRRVLSSARTTQEFHIKPPVQTASLELDRLDVSSPVGSGSLTTLRVVVPLPGAGRLVAPPRDRGLGSLPE